MSARTAVVRAARRFGLGRDPYDAFRADVEPGLNVNPRVHRFASVPVIGVPTTPLAPLTVCIDVSWPGDVAATRAALERQTLRPIETVEAGAAEALRADGAPWLVLVRAGDVPAERALERLAQAAVLAPDAAVITCDEDCLDRAGRRMDPRLRPGPSPDLMLVSDDVAAMLALRRDRARPAAGCLEYGRVGRYELLLRLSGGDGAGHAHVPQVLVHTPLRGRIVLPDADEAVARVLRDRDRAQPDSGGARVERAHTGGRRIRRRLVGEPQVDVVMLFRDRPEMLERATSSLLQRSGYERLRLHLVDNGSADPAVERLLGRLARNARVRVRRDPREFNFAALNNAAAREGEGELLLFLNNDTEVLEAGWIEALAEEAQRPDVGAVAPLLVYADGSVQHVGAALGLHGYAGHPFAGLAPDARTAFGSALDGTRNWLAVTAAAMIVQRRKFEAVGGFDESFVVAGNDVDLCLRLTAGGWRSLCVPYVAVVHHESRSRGTHIDPGDFERSRRSYGAFRTLGDPFYNPALTLTRTDCSLRRAGEGVGT